MSGHRAVSGKHQTTPVLVVLSAVFSAKGLLAALALLACTTETTGLAYRPEASVVDENEAPTRVIAVVDNSPANQAANVSESDSDAGRPLSGGSIQLLNGLVNAPKLWACVHTVGVGLAETDRSEELFEVGFARSVVVSNDRNALSPELELQLFADIRGEAATAECEQLRQLSETDVFAPSVGQQQDLRDAGLSDAGGPAPLLPVTQVGRVGLGVMAFAPGNHYLIVATGCAGQGAALDAARCGSRDAIVGATYQLLAVPFADAPSEGVGIQFLHASRATDALGVAVQYEASSQGDLTLSSAVAFGSVRPSEPALFGENAQPLTMSGLEVRIARSNTADYVQSWNDSMATLRQPLGGAYLLAYVGSDPTLAAATGFQAPRLVLLSATAQ